MQRLFFMNSGFVAAQAKQLATRLTAEAADDHARIERTYQIVFGRKPTQDELNAGLDFVTHGDNKQAWTNYVQTIFGTAEFSAVE